MAESKIILIGGGGHCKSCINVIESTKQFVIGGILDIPEKLGCKILSYSIIGNDNQIEKFNNDNNTFLITIGQIKTAGKRINIFNFLKKIAVKLPVIISPKAIISNYTSIGEGSIIMHGAIVNSDTIIGYNCIINTYSNVEHDVIIGNHSHISTGAIINGGCVLGNDIFIGSNAIISNGIKIIDKTIIGAGSVVIKDITISGIYIGNPARRIL